MTAPDLKQTLAKGESLKATETSVNHLASEEIYVLNDFEKSRLESARQQLKSNKTIPHTNVKSVSCKSSTHNLLFIIEIPALLLIK